VLGDEKRLQQGGESAAWRGGWLVRDREKAAAGDVIHQVAPQAAGGVLQPHRSGGRRRSAAGSEPISRGWSAEHNQGRPGRARGGR